eukprot:10724372-Heterocapsa_arctica.AAC.1
MEIPGGVPLVKMCGLNCRANPGLMTVPFNAFPLGAWAKSQEQGQKCGHKGPKLVCTGFPSAGRNSHMVGSLLTVGRWRNRPPLSAMSRLLCWLLKGDRLLFSQAMIPASTSMTASVSGPEEIPSGSSVP